MGTLFSSYGKRSWREWVIGGGIRINKAAHSGEVTFMLGVVIMNCRGLVDPQNKPFGNLLPLEVQVKIMFWVECFVTKDKRKKVLQEFKGLLKCDVTGFPQHLGEDRWWNQVVLRLHAPRKNGFHHCHRLFDHKLSVSEDMLFWEGLNHTLRSFFIFYRWV